MKRRGKASRVRSDREVDEARTGMSKEHDNDRLPFDGASEPAAESKPATDSISTFSPAMPPTASHVITLSLSTVSRASGTEAQGTEGRTLVDDALSSEEDQDDSPASFLSTSPSRTEQNDASLFHDSGLSSPVCAAPDSVSNQRKLLLSDRSPRKFWEDDVPEAMREVKEFASLMEATTAFERSSPHLLQLSPYREASLDTGLGPMGQEDQALLDATVGPSGSALSSFHAGTAASLAFPPDSLPSHGEDCPAQSKEGYHPQASSGEKLGLTQAKAEPLKRRPRAASTRAKAQPPARPQYLMPMQSSGDSNAASDALPSVLAGNITRSNFQDDKGVDVPNRIVDEDTCNDKYQLTTQELASRFGEVLCEGADLGVAFLFRSDDGGDEPPSVAIEAMTLVLTETPEDDETGGGDGVEPQRSQHLVAFYQEDVNGYYMALEKAEGAKQGLNELENLEAAEELLEGAEEVVTGFPDPPEAICSVELSEVLFILGGHQTPVLASLRRDQRAGEDGASSECCCSLVGLDCSLDLVAGSKLERDALISGFAALLGFR